MVVPVPPVDPSEPDVPPEGRVVLLVTSPRVAPALLSWPAWQRLQQADDVFAAEPDDEWAEQLLAAGVPVTDLGSLLVAHRAGRLLEAAGGARTVVWLGSPDGDPGLTDALADHLSRRAVVGRPPEVELVTGSHDVPGARLLDLVAVMDRLRSPGGCPWDAEQTHISLLPYLLEETHEVIEAVQDADLPHLQEELGDLLLQVAFHARVAAEHEREPFDIDDVAAGIVAKLVRRHPHVFAGAVAGSAAEVEQNWEQIKAAEKGRTGVFDGIPATLPALARAQKMLGRLARLGPPAQEEPAQAVGTSPPAGETWTAAALERAAAGDAVAAGLLEWVQRARAVGVDAESSLRSALSRLAADTHGAGVEPDDPAADPDDPAADPDGPEAGLDAHAADPDGAATAPNGAAADLDGPAG